jgi:ATP-binding cassette subfamily B (MDR/TAP) protein 1
MTILFGNLTTAFTDYGTAQFNGSSAEVLAAARSHLFSEVNKDVGILCGIGAATFVATWIYMFVFIYSGETATRRIREHYLKAILRQNVGFFDNMGPGEVTTRIETDTHLIQEGISDKVAISVQFIAIFFAGSSNSLFFFVFLFVVFTRPCALDSSPLLVPPDSS